MGRIYSVGFSNVTMASVVDMLQIKGATGKMLRIKRLWWSSSDVTLATSQMVTTAGKYMPATVTDGTGGSTATPQAAPGDAAASFTCLTNNTGAATTGGTASVKFNRADHLYNGMDLKFDDAEAPTVGPTDSFILALTTAVSGTVHLSAGATVEEIGGAA